MTDEERDVPLPVNNTQEDFEEDDKTSCVSDSDENSRRLRSSLSFSSSAEDWEERPPKNSQTSSGHEITLHIKPHFVKPRSKPEDQILKNLPLPMVEPKANTSVQQQPTTPAANIEYDYNAAFFNRKILGWFFYDIATSPFPNTVLAFMGPYMTLVAQEAQLQSGGDNLPPLGISAESFFSYCLTVSVIVQIISYLLFGSLADYGTSRKTMLIITSLGGSIAVVLCILVNPADYWTAGILLVVANVFYGLSLVFYNSFLPYLVKAHPGYQGRPAVGPQAVSSDETIASALSTYGFMLGFAAGVTMLLINIIIFYVLPESCRPQCSGCPQKCYQFCTADWNPERCDKNHLAFRINISLTGCWWLFFALFTYVWLTPVKGRNFPPQQKLITLGFSSTYNTFKRIKDYPETFRFIIAFWVYGDGLSTLAYAAWFLAAQTLGLNGRLLGVALLISQILAAIGNYFWWYVYRKFPSFWRPKMIIVVNICISCMVPLWAFMMQSPIEFFVAACLFGFANAPVQAFSRSTLSSLIPAGREAQFYSIYGLTDRGSSWLGPLVVGIIIDVTQNIRTGVIAITLLLGAGLAILLTVDVHKGIRNALVNTNTET